MRHIKDIKHVRQSRRTFSRKVALCWRCRNGDSNWRRCGSLDKTVAQFILDGLAPESILFAITSPVPFYSQISVYRSRDTNK